MKTLELSHSNPGHSNTAYWTCQILGWGSYSVIGVFIAIESEKAQGIVPDVRGILIGFALFFIYSVGLTHLLRREIRRRGWLAMPYRRSIPRLLGASALTGLAMAALVILFSAPFQHPFGWDAPALASLITSLVAFTIAWTTIYVAHTSSRSALESRLVMREAELRALEGQVNPHFLFNCLNTIRGMIVENPAQAQDMITRLANIFRYNLQHHREHTLPLAQEIEIVSDYLALERIRFEDRLRVSISIDPAAANTPVPAMLLQTLVENALKHGLSNLPEGGDLVIQAAIQNDELVLRVENTGVLAEPKPGETTQIGLKNARERLQLLYGDRASLSLVNFQGGRVAATVLIPPNGVRVLAR